MTRVLLLGDTHGNNHNELNRAFQHAQNSGAEYIIQLGDFGYQYTKQFLKVCDQSPVPLYFLRGNHDNTTIIRQWNHGQLHGHNPVQVTDQLWYLPDGCRLTIGGTHIAVLGGAHSIDHQRRQQWESWWPDETTPTHAVTQLLHHNWNNHYSKPSTVDVLLCHDVPECPPTIADHIGKFKFDPCSQANRILLRHVFDHLKPAKVFHGHYHYAYCEQYAGAEFVGLDCVGPESRMIADF